MTKQPKRKPNKPSKPRTIKSTQLAVATGGSAKIFVGGLSWDTVG